MGLALWVLPGATISQMRHAEHNNTREILRVVDKCQSAEEMGGGRHFIGRGVYVFGVKCTTEATGLGATDTYDVEMCCCCCCCCCDAGCM